ncbi:MAG: arylesterase [Saprospiraceae bacterium]|nr:arylesterase [Saprospiraceae bacterium]
MKYLLLCGATIFSLVFLGACKDKQTSEEVVVTKETNKQDNSTEIMNSDQKTILCFGNSLTAGYGLDEDKAWPQLLQERLDSLNMDYNVVNAGLSGETSSGGLNRIDWVLSQQVDIFILELGANDMLRGIDVQSTEANLNAIIEKVHAKYPDIPIIVAGMLSPPNMGAAYETSFNAIFPSLSKRHNGKLIPFFLEGVAGKAELNLADAKHPNEEGQYVVLENVWSVLKDVL